MNFIPYKTNEVLEYTFYQLPIELFVNKYYKTQLSLEAKVLYGLLLNHLTLSIKNNWRDENNNVYVILTRDTAGKLLSISNKTTSKAFKELKECKLINEIKRGCTKPNYIYVGKIQHDNSIPNMMRKIYTSGNVKSTSQEMNNLHTNYNDNKYNKETKRKKANFEQREYVKGELDYLIKNCPSNLDSLYES